MNSFLHLVESLLLLLWESKDLRIWVCKRGRVRLWLIDDSRQRNGTIASHQCSDWTASRVVEIRGILLLWLASLVYQVLMNSKVLWWKLLLYGQSNLDLVPVLFARLGCWNFLHLFLFQCLSKVFELSLLILLEEQSSAFLWEWILVWLFSSALALLLISDCRNWNHIIIDRLINSILATDCS